ncbi:universal stress protein [Nitriliruptor alkaliphilus]|uniref:universal stress protein n=1 Tax=Nitriliruptor alkaliphilus TaxID=427918 RepID=UPI0006965231|nr:universal stress protein [Nitriliruptor alkaliphilus]
MGRIVVGIDGSEGSRRALRWAVDEAARRGATLDVIHTYEPVTNVESIGTAAQADKLFNAAGDAARDIVDSAVITIEGVEARGRAIESLDPAATLVEESRDADLLVVSSRGRGSFKSLLLGSVSQQCAHHARCPVVIVPAGATDTD